jgi:carboxypeptidase Taq
MKKRIEKLEILDREIKTMQGVSSLLDWDMQTRMPSRGGASRADQQAWMQSRIHEKICSKEMGAALAPFRKKGAVSRLSDRDRALVRDAEKHHVRARKIPAALIDEMARLDSIAFRKWTRAREKSDFKAFAPYLKKQVEVNRKVAKLIGYDKTPYDALIEDYEPGATSAWIEEVFSGLKEQLIPLVKKIKRAPDPPSTTMLTRRYDVDKQWQFTLQLLGGIGYDFDAGRQDKSVHPFTTCIGGASDIRITTRLNEKDLRPAVFGSLHEGGHALYEQGTGKSIDGTCLGGGSYCAAHESQSLTWEDIVGRSLPFWRHWFPKLKRLFPEALSGVKLHDFYRAVNKVTPSFIRVEADEVTYALHIVLRFEIERDLIEGNLSVAQIPKVWNAKMKEYLGITPPNDRLGVLQDVHWSAGYFGYFPTYALGKLYAAQFFHFARQSMPDMDARISRGDLAPLKDWLSRRIYRHGKIYRASELIRRVTGKPLDPGYFMRYLEEKFGKIYKL